MASIESTFRIVDRGAIRTLRDVRMEAERTDRALLRAGAAADTVGGPRAQRNYQNAERGIGRIRNEVDKTNRSLGIFHNRWVMIGGAVLAATPLITRAAGALTQFVGSLLQAAGGAGVVGGGALGAFAAGIASVMLVAKGLTEDIQNAQKAYAAYGTAVAQYGVKSKQAATDAFKLNQALKEAPRGTLQLVTSLKQLSTEWDRATAKARGYMIQTAGHAVGRARSFLPQIAGLVTRNVRAATGGANSFIDRVLSGESLSILERVSRVFRQNVPAAADALANLVLSFGRLVAAAGPFVHQFVRDFDLWTQRLNIATRDTDYLHFRMGQMVGQLREWLRLGGAVLHFFAVLGSSLSSNGKEIQGITDAFQQWALWFQNNPVRVQRFWQQATAFAQAFGKALVFTFGLFVRLTNGLDPLMGAIGQLLRTLGPQLLTTLQNILTTVALISGALGGLGGPLAIALHFLNGILSAFNWLLAHVPALGTVLAGALTIVGIRRMVIAMSQFTGGITNAIRGMLGLAEVTNAAAAATGRLAGSAAVAGGAAAYGPGGFIGGGARRAGGVGTEILPRMDEYGRTTGRVFMAPAASTGILGRAGGALRGLGTLRGAAGAAGIAALVGGIGLSMIPGVGGNTRRYASNIGTGAALGATAGSFVGPLGMGIGAGIGALGGLAVSAFGGGRTAPSDARYGAFQRAVAGTPYTVGQHAVPRVSYGGRGATITTTSMVGGHTVDPLSLQQQLARTGGASPRTAAQISRQVGVYNRFIGLLRGDQGQQAVAARQALVAQRGALTAALPQVRAQERHRDVMGAESLLPRLGSAYNVVYGARGPQQAMQFVTQQALARWATLGPAGKRVLASALVQWADEMRRQNPALSGQFEALKNSIIGKFVTIRGQLRIVHGQILTGTREEWAKISKSMSDPVEVARQLIDKNLTIIQQKALASLQAMGATPETAARLVKQFERGVVDPSNLSRGAVAPTTKPGARALGGRIAGQGVHDNVMFGGARTAPGELVVNRHTEQRANGILAMHGVTLGGMVAGESRAHSKPMATGGRLSLSSLLPDASGLGGVPGAMVDTTGLLVSAATVGRLNNILAGGTSTGGKLGGPGGNFSAPGSADLTGNKKLAYQMMLQMGWGPEQWGGLYNLWMGESGFNQYAYNSSSGATGIPQSLPGSKMASAGPDWKTNPATQISWGLNYISGRYGSPNAAYSQWLGRSPHWYGTGGDFVARRPTLIGVGEHGDERVQITRGRGRRGVGTGTGGGIVVYVDIGRIDAGNPGAVKDMVVGQIRDAIAEVRDELAGIGMAPEERLLR